MAAERPDPGGRQCDVGYGDQVIVILLRNAAGNLTRNIRHTPVPIRMAIGALTIWRALK